MLFSVNVLRLETVTRPRGDGMTVWGGGCSSDMSVGAIDGWGWFFDPSFTLGPGEGGSQFISIPVVFSSWRVPCAALSDSQSIMSMTRGSEELSERSALTTETRRLSADVDMRSIQSLTTAGHGGH